MSDFQTVNLLIENMDAGLDGPLSAREVACVNKGWQHGETASADEITRLQADNEALRERVAELVDGLSEIERFGHGNGHGRGYTCANMAQRLLDQDSALERQSVEGGE